LTALHVVAREVAVGLFISSGRCSITEEINKYGFR
jgi:hypothetical protein